MTQASPAAPEETPDLVEEEAAFVASFEPKDNEHALSDSNWVNAMHEELENFEKKPSLGFSRASTCL